jgi:3'(2'), 5'-bisphosphate nucleotidase
MDQKTKQTCLNAVEKAMGICQQVQSALVSEQTLVKKDRSPVTVADYASQIILIHALRELTPGVLITAEEEAGELAHADQTPLRNQVLEFCRQVHPTLTEMEMMDLLASGSHPGGGREPFWTLDPIDGTKGFLRGDQYAVALAKIEQGEVLFGILGCPNLGLPHLDPSHQGYLLSAERGGGAEARSTASAEPTRIHVDATGDCSDWKFCEPFESAHSSHEDAARLVDLLGITQPPLRMDSQAKYAACAAGLTHAYLRLPTRPAYEEKVWDHAAGMILVEEAGGRVSDVNGKPLDFSRGRTLSANRGILASTGVFHEQLISGLQTS